MDKYWIKNWAILQYGSLVLNLKEDFISKRTSPPIPENCALVDNSSHLVDNLDNWTAPNSLFIKINVDGVVGDGTFASAVIARDELGMFRGCGTCFKNYSGDSLEAEIMAFGLGVECAKNLGLSHCIIEGDAQVIIRFLSDVDAKIPWKIRNAVQNIKSSLSCFEDVRFQYVLRSVNKVAHELARYALNCMLSDWWWHPTRPTVIVELLSAESFVA